jgi:hypothetical protein
MIVTASIISPVMASVVMAGAPSVLSWIHIPGTMIRVWTTPSQHMHVVLFQHFYFSGVAGFPSSQVLARWESMAQHDQNFHVAVTPQLWLP